MKVSGSFQEMLQKFFRETTGTQSHQEPGMATPGGMSKDKYRGMKCVKLPCRGGKTRRRYLEVETTKKIFKENIPNTYKRDPSHG